MPPIIKRVEVEKKTNKSFRLTAAQAERLEAYAAYTNVKPAVIVATAIEHVINSDAEFLRTLAVTPIENEKKRRTAA
jgi:predicted DNA-binding protein